MPLTYNPNARNAPATVIQSARVVEPATSVRTPFAQSRFLAVSPALTFADVPGTGDIKVLNFALLLEALETDFYVQAYQRLTNGGTNAAGTTIPGLRLNPNLPDVRYVRNFTAVERKHRDFLNGVLGSDSVLTMAPFSTATFSFGLENMTRQQVIETLYTIEFTGTRAYLGAIPFFSTTTYLQTAAAIQGTEARHTTTVAIVLNSVFGQDIDVAPMVGTNNAIETTLPPDDVLAAVSPFINLS